MKLRIDFTGFQALQLFFKQARSAGNKFGEAWVGSAVVYGPYNEFGTERMVERPHWRPGIAEVVAELTSSRDQQAEVLDHMMAQTMPVPTIDSTVHAPMVVALKIERRVKRIMTAKGVIDTGNYRGSVTVGKTEADAYEDSVALADPDTV